MEFHPEANQVEYVFAQQELTRKYPKKREL
jgi:transposase